VDVTLPKTDDGQGGVRRAGGRVGLARSGRFPVAGGVRTVLLTKSCFAIPVK